MPASFRGSIQQAITGGRVVPLPSNPRLGMEQALSGFGLELLDGPDVPVIGEQLTQRLGMPSWPAARLRAPGRRWRPGRRGSKAGWRPEVRRLLRARRRLLRGSSARPGRASTGAAAAWKRSWACSSACLRAVSRMAWLSGSGVMSSPRRSHLATVALQTPRCSANASTVRRSAALSSLASRPVHRLSDCWADRDTSGPALRSSVVRRPGPSFQPPARPG
jgi:hypothetical protein